MKSNICVFAALLPAQLYMMMINMYHKGPDLQGQVPHCPCCGQLI